MNTQMTGFHDALGRLGLSGWKPTGKTHFPTTADTGAQARAGVAAMARQAEALHYGETFRLEIVTRDGDRVRVDVRQMLQAVHASEAKIAGYAGPEGVAVVGSRAELEAGRFEARFGLHVQGELDEDEMKALKSIFEQVADLADQFYGGNIPAALQAAKALQVDGSEIGNVSLNMTQQITYARIQQQAAAAYVEVERARPTTGPDPVRAARQVTRYWAQVEQVQQVIQTTFRSFSLTIETMIGGGDRRAVSAIEQVHEEIRKQVKQLRAMLGLPEEEATTADAAQAEDRTAEPKEKAGKSEESDSAVRDRHAATPEASPAAPAAAESGESGGATASAGAAASDGVPREQKVDAMA